MNLCSCEWDARSKVHLAGSPPGSRGWYLALFMTTDIQAYLHGASSYLCHFYHNLLTFGCLFIPVDPQEDYNISCLIMVYIAVSLRVLVRSESTIYSPVLDAHPNNCHCFAKAINAIAGALFTVARPRRCRREAARIPSCE